VAVAFGRENSIGRLFPYASHSDYVFVGRPDFVLTGSFCHPRISSSPHQPHPTSVPRAGSFRTNKFVGNIVGITDTGAAAANTDVKSHEIRGSPESA